MKRIAKLSPLVIAGIVGIVSLVPRPAFALGNVILKTPQVTESANGEWDVTLRITLDQAPATPPILYFTFTETVTFENTLEVRGQPPVVHRLPVDPAHKFPPESMPVDTFTDTVTHNPVKTTFWTVPVKRAAGYEAGVFQLQVSTTDGQNVGQPMTVTLNGDNPVVDRADISFGGKIQSVHSGVDAGAPQVAQNDDNGDGTDTTSTAPAGSAAPMVGDQAFQEQPEEVKNHAKGCGCTVPGTDTELPWGGAGVGLGALVLGGVVAGRRRAPRGARVPSSRK